MKRMVAHAKVGKVYNQEQIYETRGVIAFDMDGTIADFYHVPDWLAKLEAEDPSPYLDAKPLVDMNKLREILIALSAKGWEIRIISWLSKDASPEFKKAIRQAKRQWLAKYNFPADKVHLVQYGTTKMRCIRNFMGNPPAILIDDDSKVRDGWRIGEAWDPAEEDILEKLEQLLEEE